MGLALANRRAALLQPWLKNELWRRARAVPSLDLRFAENKSLFDATTGANLVTFSRASGGTYVDSQGVICTATTNLFLQSENLATTWLFTRSSFSSNAVAAPNGTLTADKLVEDTTASNSHYVYQRVSVVLGATYTASFYVKAAERSSVAINFFNTNSAFTQSNAIFNLANGTITHSSQVDSASIVSVGDGWYRISATETATATATGNIAIMLVSTGTTQEYTGDGTSGIYLWGAQLEQSSSVGEYIPTDATINSAPRFDHNPTTGESLGLLVEEARTNSIRNNTMVGAVAGTPGTLPTNWAQNSNTGLSFSVSGVGVENGINYVEFTLSGTTASSTQNNVFFESSGAVAATNNQTWASSVFCRVVSSSNISGYSLGINDNVSFTQTTIVPTATYQRFSVVRTTGGSGVTSINTYLQVISPPAPATVSLVIRIGLPQLEQGAFATSVIPTSGTAATRSADVCSISGSNYSSWATSGAHSVFVRCKGLSSTMPAAQVIANISDGSGVNFSRIFHVSGGGALASQNMFSAGANPGRIDAGSTYSNVEARIASVFALQDRALCVNSSAVSASATGSLPVGMTKLDLGSDNNVTPYSGHISRFVYWPARLSNNVLQELTR